MPLTMSRAEREEFLAGVHVGVLSVASGDGGGPLAVPVWYAYQPGGTGERDHRPRHPQGRGPSGPRAGSACAPRTSARPTSTSRSRARSSIEDGRPTPSGWSWPAGTWAPKAGDAYMAANPGGTQVMIRMTPEHWLSVDYGRG